MGFAAAHAIEKKYGVQIVGEGESGGDKYKKMSFSFSTYTLPLKVDEVRPIIVSMIEDFLNDMNAHPEIAKEFVQFPLTLENIGIGIILMNLQGEDVYDPFVEGVFNIGYNLCYLRNVYIPPQPGVYGKKDNNFRESFAEAKAILNHKEIDLVK